MATALQKILAEHEPDQRAAASQAAARQHQARLRAEGVLEKARRAAMRAAEPVCGRVIFPGRWSAGRMRGYDSAVECVARWEGLTLLCECFEEAGGRYRTRLVVAAPGKPSRHVGTAADLAAYLREQVAA